MRYVAEDHEREECKRRRDYAAIVGLGLTALFTLGLATVGLLQTFAFVESERAVLTIYWYAMATMNSDGAIEKKQAQMP